MTEFDLKKRKVVSQIDLIPDELLYGILLWCSFKKLQDLRKISKRFKLLIDESVIPKLYKDNDLLIKDTLSVVYSGDKPGWDDTKGCTPCLLISHHTFICSGSVCTGFMKCRCLFGGGCHGCMKKYCKNCIDSLFRGRCKPNGDVKFCCDCFVKLSPDWTVREGGVLCDCMNRK